MMMKEKKSQNLQVQCPECNAIGEIPWEQLTGGKITLRCAKCGQKFPYLNERRKAYRKVPLPLAHIGPYSFNFDKPGKKAYIADISMDGMKLNIDQLPQDKFVSVSFQLPGQKDTIKVRGEIMWTKPLEKGGCQLGLMFTSLDEHSRKNIGFFLR